MQVELLAVTPDAEKVIEAAGRTAYQSFDRVTARPIVEARSGDRIETFRADDHPSLPEVRIGDRFPLDNETWTALRVWPNSAAKFIAMIIRQGHLSVLEHASATVRFQGGSRAFTHQLVRHRMAAFTQQSQRYVGEERFQAVVPPSIEQCEPALVLFSETMEKIQDVYRRLKDMGIRNEDARFVLPNSVTSEIVVTTNLREWRHIVEERGKPNAQWEIRSAAVQLVKIFEKRIPSVFFDFEVDDVKGIVRKPSEKVERR